MRLPGITGSFKSEASSTPKQPDLSPQESNLALMALAARGVVVRENDKAGLMRGIGQELNGHRF